MRYVIEVFRSPGGVHGSVVDEGGTEEEAGRRTPFHGWLELLALLEPPPELSTESAEASAATDEDSCDV
ncbi:hypothetical protein ACIBKX_34375 [Streptomyces sp. NPDC050658]|uniref:hypothetical protein n=1 Tax=unclassified Streptomyces TaxID=2593676 RepID=UPI00344268C8